VGFDDLRLDFSKQPTNSHGSAHVVRSEAAPELVYIDRLDPGLIDKFGALPFVAANSSAYQPAPELLRVQISRERADVPLRAADAETRDYSRDADRSLGRMHQVKQFKSCVLKPGLSTLRRCV